jgi:pullulanase/glycogen debranching enzyme
MWGLTDGGAPGGSEGFTRDARVQGLRQRQMRNMLVALMLSRGASVVMGPVRRVRDRRVCAAQACRCC